MLEQGKRKYIYGLLFIISKFLLADFGPGEIESVLGSGILVSPRRLLGGGMFPTEF